MPFTNISFYGTANQTYKCIKYHKFRICFSDLLILNQCLVSKMVRNLPVWAVSLKNVFHFLLTITTSLALNCYLCRSLSSTRKLTHAWCCSSIPVPTTSSFQTVPWCKSRVHYSRHDVTCTPSDTSYTVFPFILHFTLSRISVPFIPTFTTDDIGSFEFLRTKCVQRGLVFHFSCVDEQTVL